MVERGKPKARSSEVGGLLEVRPSGEEECQGRVLPEQELGAY